MLAAAKKWYRVEGLRWKVLGVGRRVLGLRRTALAKGFRLTA